MKVVFRADASLQIGTGHVMRCLTLADALREQGETCSFICRSHEGHLLELIAQRGHHAVALSIPQAGTARAPVQGEPSHTSWLGTDWNRDARETRDVLGVDTVDWLVVDHYALDSQWERALRSHCRHIMVIDDLADREHDCDLLLDQNLGRLPQDYQGLLPASAMCVTGPQYSLLRPEFSRWRADSLARRTDPRLKHLLISMGGVDKDNATGCILEALQTLYSLQELRITVVMGPHAPWLQQVRAQAAQMAQTVEVLTGISDMARLMAESDLAIGAAGSTSWERCCLGLPSIMLVLADNQRGIASSLEQVGAALLLEQHDIGWQLPSLISSLCKSPISLVSMSQKAADIVDGQGVAAIIELLESRC